MLMRRNVAAGIGSNEQGEYCRVALQRSDRKEPRYKWPTLLYFTFSIHSARHGRQIRMTLSDMKKFCPETVHRSTKENWEQSDPVDLEAISNKPISFPGQVS